MRSVLLTEKQNIQLANMHIAVVGCGGLGGVAIDGLVRSGARHITIIDGDTFDISNSNRQLFACVASIGANKATYTAEALMSSLQLPQGSVSAYPDMITADNIGVLEGMQMIFDCTDNVECKLLLESYAVEHSIPLIHGSVDGYYGQVVLIEGSALLGSIYSQPQQVAGNDYMTVATVASVQLSVLYSYICGRATAGLLYSIDMHSNSIDSIPINNSL